MTDSDLSRRRFLQATGAAAAATALAGCAGGGSNDNQNNNNNQSGGGNQGGGGGGNQGGGNQNQGDGNQNEEDQQQQDQQQGPGKTDRTYKLVTSSMTTFDPIAATDTASGEVIQNVFDALMEYPSAQIPVVQRLAASYETSSGGTTYTFKIKQDATFSNGDPVTSADMVYSFERLAASPNSKRAGFLLEDLGVVHDRDSDDNYVPDSLGLATPDEKTLVMNLTEPNGATLSILAYSAFSAVPEGVVGDIEGYQGQMEYKSFAQENPIGAGPYTLDKYTPGTEAAIAARDDYYMKGPMTAGSHWQIIEQDSAAYAYSVVNLNADEPVIPTAQYNQSKLSVEGRNEEGYAFGTYGPMANDITGEFYRVGELSTFYYGFYCASVPLFARKAVALVNNNQIAVEQIYKTPQKAAFHFTPPDLYPGGIDAYNKHAQQYPYGFKQSNITEARALMEENGYGPNNPYEFTMTSYTDDTQTRILNVLRQQLRQAHINMSVTQAPFSTLIQRAYSGNTDAYTLGWIADWPAPSNFLKLAYPPQTDTSTGNNLSGFNWLEGQPSQQAAEAFETLQSLAPNQEQQRNQAVIDMLEAIWDGVPLITTTHSIAQHIQYPWVYKRQFGPMGPSRAMHNRVELGPRGGSGGGQ